MHILPLLTSQLNSRYEFYQKFTVDLILFVRNIFERVSFPNYFLWVQNNYNKI